VLPLNPVPRLDVELVLLKLILPAMLDRRLLTLPPDVCLDDLDDALKVEPDPLDAVLFSGASVCASTRGKNREVSFSRSFMDAMGRLKSETVKVLEAGILCTSAFL
jgi:hypothetical protein